MEWLAQLFGVAKPIIAMAHLPPTPGTPLYDQRRGMNYLVESVRADVTNLQAGGVDGVLFCNEGDRPYLTQVGSEVVSAMSRVVAEVSPTFNGPFGCDILWDPLAALSVANATGASFVREVFTGLFAGDIGLWETRAGEALRHRRNIGGDGIRCFFNITAEFAHSLDQRQLALIARSTVFSSLADAICVSGPMTGESASLEHLAKVKEALPDVPVFANTGVRLENIADVLKVADGVIVGTALKVGGITWNPVDGERVKRLVAAARG